MRLVHNTTSQFAYRQLASVRNQTDGNVEKLSSGKRINHASDDAAGLMISDRMAARANGTKQAAQNIQDAVSVAQVVDGAYSTLVNMLQRIRQMAVQSASDVLVTNDRANVQAEVAQLVNEIDRVASTTTFNGRRLLQTSGGEATWRFQVGADQGNVIEFGFASVTAATLGVSTVDVSTRTGAEDVLTAIDGALDLLAGHQANVGSIENRLRSALEFVGVSYGMTEQARSRIQDTDFAEEVTHLSRNQLMAQASTSALSQANLAPEAFLNLLQG